MAGTIELRLAWTSVPPARAERRAAAWQLVRELLSREGYEAVTLSNPCLRCGAPHGPIRVEGAPWLASVSYAGTIAVAAIHPRSVAGFAIDAELLDEPQRDTAGVPGGLLRWVRTEAALKADGRGLRVAPESVKIVENPRGWTAVLPDAPPLRGEEPSGAYVVPGVLVSVAVREGRAEASDRASS